MKIWLSTFYQLLFAKMSDFMILQFLFLSDLVQQHNLLETQIVHLCQFTGIIDIDHFTDNLHLNFISRIRIFRQREKSVFLNDEHSPNATADGIDHIQINHSLNQERVTVNGFRGICSNYIFHISRNESAGIDECHFSILVFYDIDLSAKGIILMRNGIVQCLTDNKWIVLIYFIRKQ